MSSSTLNRDQGSQRHANRWPEPPAGGAGTAVRKPGLPPPVRRRAAVRPACGAMPGGTCASVATGAPAHQGWTIDRCGGRGPETEDGPVTKIRAGRGACGDSAEYTGPGWPASQAGRETLSTLVRNVPCLPSIEMSPEAVDDYGLVGISTAWAWDRPPRRPVGHLVVAEPPGMRRRTAGPVRMCCAANARNGAATLRSQSSTTVPASGHGLRRVARCAAMMLPPETALIVSSPERMPSSFRRRTAPRWNSAARTPPPDRHRARPVRHARDAARYVSSACRESARSVGMSASQGEGGSLAWSASSGAVPSTRA